jgi:hypothetical protein
MSARVQPEYDFEIDGLEQRQRAATPASSSAPLEIIIEAK